MKKFLIAFSITILTLSGCAAGVDRDPNKLSTQEEQKDNEYQNISFANGSIDLEFPSGWYENKDEHPFDLQYFSQNQDTNTGIFLYDLEDLPTNSTPQGIFAAHIDDLKSKRDNFTVLEPEKIERIDDKTLTTIVYSGDKDASNNYYKFTLIEFAKNPTQFLVALQVSVPSEWSKNKPILENIIRSAEMKKS
jgi:hypothetical protein